ncbi:thiamine-phosphate pyrophosphorylase [Halohasta litchfieldiae]|jgi:thiamine-phosphate pyrophosphorylase|uniref:Thiamine-phosphate synthase n=1 Tax=Halohasta litchfieldiae TaxID=1073996 RepID=A0A1H6X7K3_9EURY|nr:thiamine phosphate synthase [Halohasta litchfieldiae]ATW87286.1 thiamine-phosphate pyrophosphorylase [Halohasta litchfieldiae]SEJ24036.1 thiamine-phosphate diphosphorylase [Halohasta litchfieldiae]
MNPDQWRTYLVTQESLSEGRSTTEIVEAAIEGGVDAIQLREKDTDARTRYELGRELRELTAEADIDLIVNDRVDIARAIDADGVHLGQSDLPVSVAREQLGDDAIIGASVSTVSEARLAAITGADYLGVGAVYGTNSKVDAPTADDGLGVDELSNIVETVKIPVVAIGGITPNNAAAAIEAGATSVAAISAITAADDPAAATRELRAAVDSAMGDEVTAEDAVEADDD